MAPTGVPFTYYPSKENQETCPGCKAKRGSRQDEETWYKRFRHPVEEITSSRVTENTASSLVFIKKKEKDASFMVGALTAEFKKRSGPTEKIALIAFSGDNYTKDYLKRVPDKTFTWKSADLTAQEIPNTYYDYPDRTKLQKWHNVKGRCIDFPGAAYEDYFPFVPDPNIANDQERLNRAREDHYAQIRGKSRDRTCAALKLLLTLGKLTRGTDLWERSTEIRIHMAETYYRSLKDSNEDYDDLAPTKGEVKWVRESCDYCKVRIPRLLCDAPNKKTNEKEIRKTKIRHLTHGPAPHQGFQNKEYQRLSMCASNYTG